MRRIAIVGPGGAGKSTFANALGQIAGLPVVHLDEHFWQPGWVEPERDEWHRLQARLFDTDRWIADGNYGGSFDVRFARADTVIVIARPRLACLVGAIGRSLRNHGRSIQAAGCPERFQLSFYRWIWNYDRDSRPRLDVAVERHPHLRVIELRSRTEIDHFLAGFAST